MPVFPAQNGSDGTWGTELGNYFSPYFDLTTGDFLGGISKGNITINKADPAIVFDSLTAGDTDFWIGVTENADAADNDLFQIGDGSTPGVNPFVTIDTSGNVGIGTANPAQKLHVNGDARIGGSVAGDYVDITSNSSVLTFSQSNSGAGGHEFSFNGPGWSNDYFRFMSGATEIMRIIGSGNVGIGTATPVEKLQVGGAENIRVDGGFLLVRSSGRLRLYNGDNLNFSEIYSTGSAGDTVFRDGSGETMRLAQGNVGIGTANPAQKLHVNGQSQFGQIGTAGGLILYSSVAIGTGAFAKLEPQTTGALRVTCGNGDQSTENSLELATNLTADTNNLRDIGEELTRFRSLFLGSNISIGGAFDHEGTTAGFYGTAPITKQVGVAVTAAGIHAALVNLGLIGA